MAALLAVFCMSVVAAVKVSSDPVNAVVAPVERKAVRANESASAALRTPSAPRRDEGGEEIEGGDRVASLSTRRIDGDFPPLFDSPNQARKRARGRKNASGVRGGIGAFGDDDAGDDDDNGDGDGNRDGVASASGAQLSASAKAPPLPFGFLGRMFEGGKTILFLSMNGKSIIVRTGDTINGVYRVSAIEKETVEFIYLPLREKQTLFVGSPGSKGGRS
jgi:hypothetical protein